VDLSKIISYVAAATARAYPQATREDVSQQLWAHAQANLPRLFDYMQRQDGERIIRSILNQEARTYAIKERAAVTGYAPDDQEWYTPNQIRAILPDVYEYENWQSFERRGQERRATPIANATGDRLAAILDVRKALDQILPDQRDILRQHYGEGWGLEDIGEAWSISEGAARQRLHRAVHAVRNALGGPRPGDPYEAVNGPFDTRSKGRKAMSNSAARTLTHGDY
jgi:RNA polymerase sigma factor (sigma-70 family)